MKKSRGRPKGWRKPDWCNYYELPVIKSKGCGRPKGSGKSVNKISDEPVNDETVPKRGRGRPKGSTKVKVNLTLSS